MNLRHFIYSNKKPQSDDDVSSEGDYPLSYCYTRRNPPVDEPIDDKTPELRREIQRIPTFAIFHKLAVGKGVPHTFVGKFIFFTLLKINSRLLLAFVRQWPALPRVVVGIFSSDSPLSLINFTSRCSYRSALFHCQEYLLQNGML
jgi:KUP system potassium uptake protein